MNCKDPVEFINMNFQLIYTHFACNYNYRQKLKFVLEVGKEKGSTLQMAFILNNYNYRALILVPNVHYARELDARAKFILLFCA